MRGKRRIVKKWPKQHRFAPASGVIVGGGVMMAGAGLVVGAVAGGAAALAGFPEGKATEYFFQLDNGKKVRVSRQIYDRHKVGDFTWDIYPSAG